MSEIVYPSEVLPEIDWESPLGVGGVHSACIFKSITDKDIVTPSNAVTFFDGVAVGSNSVDCSTSTTSDAVSFDYNPLLTQSSGAFVFTLDIFSGDHFSHASFINFTESSQRYFIFGYNRDRKVFYLSQRNGATGGADFVHDIITDNTTLHQKRTFCISWSQSGTTRTYTLSSKQGSVSFDVDSGLWSAVVPVLFKKYWYRISNYSVLNYDPTPEQLDIIFNNGYSLFKTQKSVSQEYGLVGDGEVGYITHEDIVIPPNQDFEIYLRFKRNSLAGHQGLFGAASGVFDFVFIFSNGGIRTRFAGADNTSEYKLTDTDWHDLIINRVGIKMLTILDGVTILDQTTNGTSNIKLSILLANTNVSYESDSSISTYKISTKYPDSRFWEFNQTKGDTVIDHYHGAVATLNNFPADSGYVRGDDGAVVGYQFANSVSTTLLMTGAYTGTITFDDDTTQAISGSGNHLVNTGLIKRITATDTVASFDWDFTTGDQGKIIDTVGNNHATIVNDSVVKWQPIVPVDVFTIGTGKDYDLTSQWYAVHNNNTSVKRLILHEMENDDFVTAGNANNKGLQFVAAKGLEPIENVAQVGYTGEIYNTCAGDVVYESIGVSNLKLYGATNLVDSCVVGLTSAGKDNIYCGNSSGIYVIKKTYIKANPANASDGVFGADINDITKTAVIDCIVEGAGRFGTIYSTVTNTIYKNIANTDNFSGMANNCVTTKSTLTGDGNIVNAQPDWFEDNGNISTVGQTALAGKGFNGTDIASWAYYVDEATGDISVVSVVTGGGTTPTVLGTSKLLGIANVSANGTLGSIVNVNKDVFDYISGNGNTTAVTGLIRAVLSNVSGGGTDSLTLAYTKMLNSSVSAGGYTTGLVSVIKNLILSISASGEASSSVLADKYIQSLVSAEGNQDNLVSIVKSVTGIITGNGNNSNSIEFDKRLATAISGNGNITSVTGLVGAILAVVTGGGSVLSTVEVNKLVGVAATGGSITQSEIAVAKSLDSAISASGYCSSVISSGRFDMAYISGNGIDQVSILKDVGSVSNISATASISSDTLIDKFTSSGISSNTSGILVDLSKGVYQWVGATTGGLSTCSVSVDKVLNSIILSGNGIVSSVYLRDFADNNIIFISSDSIAESIERVLSTTAISNYKELTVNANTKPG